MIKITGIEIAHYLAKNCKKYGGYILADLDDRGHLTAVSFLGDIHHERIIRR